MVTGIMSDNVIVATRKVK